MAPPIAVTPQEEDTDLETISSLTTQGIEHALQNTSPPQLKSTPLSDLATKSPPSSTAPPQNGGPLAPLDASLLESKYTTHPRPVPALNSPEMASQRTCTDHMIIANWNSTTGWSAPALQPYGPLTLMPTASCLHYATSCFEGMKLYRGHDGKLRLFRPELNCARMVVSAGRIALPEFEAAELLKLIVKLCAVDGGKWLPKERAGSFLYIRPTMVASDPALGVQRPSEAMLFIMLTCFAPMDDLAGGMKLLASQDDMVRAWPGGFGYAKVGANYGPSLVAQGEARARGYHQILWLFGDECFVTEAGASNLFVVWRTREGKVQLVTACLTERIVLDGVTRRSVLELARERLVSGYEGLEGVQVAERKFSMAEVVDAVNEGRLIEAFAAGTAWFIAPVGQIHFRGKDFTVPMGDDGKSGRYTAILKEWLRGIMWGANGQEGHEWGYIVDED